MNIIKKITDAWAWIVLVVLIVGFGAVSFTAGYYKCRMDNLKILRADLKPYSIQDSNGFFHKTNCDGYEKVCDDSVRLCEGKVIPYRQTKIKSR